MKRQEKNCTAAGGVLFDIGAGQQNGDEISSAQVAYQLKRIHWQIMEQTGGANLSIKLAIEQLDDGLEK